MKTYIVTKTYKYTETVTVEAESKKEAKDIAIDTEGERNWDDTLYDIEAKEQQQ